MHSLRRLDLNACTRYTNSMAISAQSGTRFSPNVENFLCQQHALVFDSVCCHAHLKDAAAAAGGGHRCTRQAIRRKGAGADAGRGEAEAVHGGGMTAGCGGSGGGAGGAGPFGRGAALKLCQLAAQSAPGVTELRLYSHVSNHSHQPLLA